MTLDLLLAAKKKHERAKTSLRAQVELLETDWMTGAVHAELFQVLEVFIKACEAGKAPRLLIELPPGFGKTLMVSRHLPAFIWSKHPKWFQIVGTYNQDRANEVGRDFRRVMQNETFQQLHPQLELDSRTTSMDYLETTKGGKMSFVGVGAGATGKRAHCVATGTMVSTETGPRPIEDIRVGDRVWSYDIKARRFELQPVLATSSSGVQPTRRITANGRTLECTDEHLIFDGVGYTQAHTLSEGSAVHGSPLPLPALQDSLSRRGDAPEAATAEVLWPRVPWTLAGEAAAALYAVWRATIAKARPYAVLLAGVLQRVRGSAPEDHHLPAVREGSAEDLVPPEVLREGLRECSPLGEDAGRREPALRQRGSGLAVLAGVPSHGVAAYHRARRERVRALPSHDEAYVCPSPGPQQDERRGYESHHAVREVPHHVPQAERWAVEAVHEGSHAAVHDIQVRKNCNFIANSIVIHNCFVVDDPFKDMEEADSELMRKKVDDWFMAVAYTRMLPGGGIIILHTRWHEDDLIGRRLAAAKIGGDQWMSYKFPLVATCDEYKADGTLRRKAGDSLHPERFPEEMCRKMKDTYFASKQGRIWSALYQQNPVPDDGNFFKAEWFKKGWYDPHTTVFPSARTYGITTDFATSEGSGDWSITWPFFLDDRDDIWFLADIFLEQCDTQRHAENIWKKIEEYDARYLFVERGVILNGHRPEFRTQQTRRKLYNVKMVEFSRTKKKKEHSVALANHMQQGKVHFPDTPFFRERIYPLFLGFDNLKQDDPIDAAALPFLSFHEMMKPEAEVEIPDAPPADYVHDFIKGRLDADERPAPNRRAFYAENDD